MRDNPLGEDKEEIRELVKQFHNLKSGRGHSFLEEEAYEKIIDYFDDLEDLPQAIEAADMGLEQFPYSAMLHIKKADLMIATRRYQEALEVLSHADCWIATTLIYIYSKPMLIWLSTSRKKP